MTKGKHSTTVHKLHIGAKLDLDEVEKAVNAATQKTMLAKGTKAKETELARVDLKKNETVVFFRGDKDISSRLKNIIKKKSPKAKFRVTKTTTATLAKAPKL